MYLLKHISAETLTTGQMIASGLIVHQQRYRPSDSKKNVKVKFSVHGTFLEKPSSGTLIIKRLESQVN